MTDATSGDDGSAPDSVDAAASDAPPAPAPAPPVPDTPAEPRPSPGPLPAEVTAQLPVTPAPHAVTPAPHAITPAPDPVTPAPGPRQAAAPAAAPTARHPRRWFLAGAGAVVVAGAGGVGAALLRGRSTPAPKPAPAPLLAAISAERALIADLDATTGGTPQVRQLLTQARADHAVHLRALQGVAANYDAPRPTRSPAAGTPRTASALRAAEAHAATVAAAHANSLDGRAATLLASIAACEASHAALLP